MPNACAFVADGLSCKYLAALCIPGPMATLTILTLDSKTYESYNKQPPHGLGLGLGLGLELGWE